MYKQGYKQGSQRTSYKMISKYLYKSVLSTLIHDKVQFGRGWNAEAKVLQKIIGVCRCVQNLLSKTNYNVQKLTLQNMLN